MQIIHQFNDGDQFLDVCKVAGNQPALRFAVNGIPIWFYLGDNGHEQLRQLRDSITDFLGDSRMSELRASKE